MSFLAGNFLVYEMAKPVLVKALGREYCTRRLFLLASGIGEPLSSESELIISFAGCLFLWGWHLLYSIISSCLPASFPNQTTIEFKYCVVSKRKFKSSRLS